MSEVFPLVLRVRVIDLVLVKGCLVLISVALVRRFILFVLLLDMPVMTLAIGHRRICPIGTILYSEQLHVRNSRRS